MIYVCFILGFIVCVFAISVVFSGGFPDQHPEKLRGEVIAPEKPVENKVKTKAKAKAYPKRIEYDARNKGKAILKARRQGHLLCFWHGDSYPTGLYTINGTGKK